MIYVVLDITFSLPLQVQSDLVNPYFFNPHASQSEHSSWQALPSFSTYNDSVIRSTEAGGGAIVCIHL